jgi:hypothetical protein
VYLIEKNSLRPFKDNLFVTTKRVKDESTAVPYEWREDLGLSLKLSPQLIEINVSLTLKNVLQEFILLINMSPHTLTHTVRGEKVGAPNTGPLTSVLVRWSDTATGGSDLARSTRELARLIDEDVVVENEVRVTVNHETSWVNLSPSGANTIDL